MATWFTAWLVVFFLFEYLATSTYVRLFFFGAFMLIAFL
jgi:hypothetical protein